MRKVTLFTVALALTLCLFGCGRSVHRASPDAMPSPGKPITKLPASRDVMNTRVTMKKVYRIEADFAKMEILVTKSKKDPVVFNWGGPLKVKPKSRTPVQGSVYGLSETSGIEYPLFDLPRAVRYITVSCPVIEYDADLVKFPVFSQAHLPLTRHVGTRFVTVKSMRTERNQDNPKDTDFVLMLELSPGYAPYNVKVRDARGRALPKPLLAHSVPGKDPTTVWLRFNFIGKWRSRPVSLELLSAREKAAWVTFDNVPVPPLTTKRAH